MRYYIKERADNARARFIKRSAQLALRLALIVRDDLKLYDQRPIIQIRTIGDIIYARHRDGALTVKEHFFPIGVQRACRKTPACRESTEAIGNLRRDPRKIVKHEHLSVGRCHI